MIVEQVTEKELNAIDNFKWSFAEEILSYYL